MAIGLNNLNIEAVAGMQALLPNQPLLHNCHIGSEAEGIVLKCGDIVTLTTGGNNNEVVVKKAGVTDLPIGVVAYNGIKTGFTKDDLVTVIPDNGYVFLPAGDTAIARGTKVQFDANSKVKKTSTSGNGYIGVAMTTNTAVDELIVVQVKTNK